MTDPMSLRLGDLAGPLLARCDRTGETPSEVCRLALAKELCVEQPVMDGRREHMNRVNAARQKRAKKTRGRRIRGSGGKNKR